MGSVAYNGFRGLDTASRRARTLRGTSLDREDCEPRRRARDEVQIPQRIRPAVDGTRSRRRLAIVTSQDAKNAAPGAAPGTTTGEPSRRAPREPHEALRGDAVRRAARSGAPRRQRRCRRGRRRRRPGHRRRRVLLDARPVRLRQDDDPPPDRRLRAARPRAGSCSTARTSPGSRRSSGTSTRSSRTTRCSRT